MEQIANRTFFKFVIGFLAIISVSFFIIMGTTYLAEVDAQNNTATVSEDECLGANC